jgi:hypothetical protein
MEEHRLRVFENRVLRRIFGLQRDQIIGGCRKLPNEELHNLYSSPNTIRLIKSRSMRWAGHVARMKRERNAFTILVGKPEGKTPLSGRIILKWILTEVAWGGMDRINLAQDKDQWRTHANTVKNLGVP